jgi:hypothetical protein
MPWLHHHALLARLLIAGALSGCGVWLTAQAPDSPVLSGGKFEALAPHQQRLFGDVVQRYNAIVSRRFDPSEAYDALPPSHRTTFEAVTHALATTALTDSMGYPRGSAIDLITSIDEILGETRGARGDRQFRLYVLLAPDAVDRLSRSREFTRTADNTIYHPGFPISYRLRGGTPSIQVSISRDGLRGDIDVDYRSSRIPVALINGHLTSANSDVRAGGNYTRHQGRWSGLGNWWQRFLGLFTVQKPSDSAAGALVIPVQPRTSSRARIDHVVQDFLSAWLLERQPQLAAVYFSPLSFPCMERDGAVAAGAGLERYGMLERMKAANTVMGSATALPQVSLSVNPWDPRLAVVGHRFAQAFLLARMPADLAAAYDCANRANDDGRPTLTQREFYASAFRLRIPGGPAPVLVLIWAREPGGFRVVAFDVEEAAEPTVPLRVARVETAEPRARRVAGPASLVEAVTRFHRAWFVDADIDRALSFFDEPAYACLTPFADGLVTADRASMRAMLEGVRGTKAARSTLRDAIRTIEPSQLDLAVIDHPQQGAFTLLPVPDRFGDGAVCGQEMPDRASLASQGTPVASGLRYVSYFQLNRPGDPAFLWMLWSSTGGSWTIRYWTLVTS